MPENAIKGAPSCTSTTSKTAAAGHRPNVRMLDNSQRRRLKIRMKGLEGVWVESSPAVESCVEHTNPLTKFATKLRLFAHRIVFPSSGGS